MNKYVRTKDGRIIETGDFIDIDFIDIKEYNKLMTEGTICKYNSEEVEIIKQANTPEELCDVFVLISEPLNYHRGFEKLATAKKHFYLKAQANNILKFELKGAIWTDKGLIYVAKMNDQGELEFKNE